MAAVAKAPVAAAAEGARVEAAMVAAAMAADPSPTAHAPSHWRCTMRGGPAGRGSRSTAAHATRGSAAMGWPRRLQPAWVPPSVRIMMIAYLALARWQDADELQSRAPPPARPLGSRQEALLRRALQLHSEQRLAGGLVAPSRPAPTAPTSVAAARPQICGCWKKSTLAWRADGDVTRALRVGAWAPNTATLVAAMDSQMACGG